MKVLVTGAGGFIGSHVVEELLAHGHSVRAFLHYNSEGRIGNLRFLEDSGAARPETIHGDIRDRRSVREAAAGCDAILHLAALIGIPYSYTAPESYIETNLNGTFHVLEAARELGTQRVVVTSTSEVYGTAIRSPIDEDHPLQGQSPYSASKIAADKMAEAYACSFELPVVVLRPFNTYGPRQSARAVIPTILSQILGGADTLRLGSLSPKRDLVFAGDTARAFRLAMETPGIEGEVIHFGTGVTQSVAEIVDLCFKVTGRTIPIVTEEGRIRPEKSEVGLLLADPRKAGKRLAWMPSVTLEQGLARTAEFIGAHRDLFHLDRYAI